MPSLQFKLADFRYTFLIYKFLFHTILSLSNFFISSSIVLGSTS